MRRNAELELHYAVRSRHDAAFLDELSDLLEIVSSSTPATRPGINLDETFGRLPSDALAAMCGPMHLLESGTAQLGVGRTPSLPICDTRHLAQAAFLPTASFRVRIDNSSREIVVPENKSMLDALNEGRL